MASVKLLKSGSFKITVSLGYDIYGNKKREYATFVPDPGLTPKKRQKAAEEFPESLKQR